MDILLFNHYSGTPDIGMEYRPYFFGLNWNKSGHNVTVVACSFSHSRRMQPKGCFLFKREKINGINYIWVYGNPYKGNGVMRALNILIYSFLSCFLFFSIRKKFDVIINSSTHTLDIFPSMVYKNLNKFFFKKKKIISVFEPHDLWPMVLTEIGGMHKYHPFVLLNSLGEKLSCITSDLIISMHPGNINHLAKRGANRDDFYHIPNGINVSDWSEEKQLPESIFNQLSNIKEKGSKIIMYTGTISVANDLDFLLRAISKIDDNIAPVFFGQGTELKSLIRLSEKLKINSYFLGTINKEQIPAALKFADICYVGFLKNILYQYGVSANKIWDYMMSSKPIILSIDACNDPVAEANCGITVNSHDEEDLKEAINRLINLSENDLSKLGANGKKYVIENNSYDKISNYAIELFDNKLKSL